MKGFHENDDAPLSSLFRFGIKDGEKMIDLTSRFTCVSCKHIYKLNPMLSVPHGLRCECFEDTRTGFSGYPHATMCLRCIEKLPKSNSNSKAYHCPSCKKATVPRRCNQTLRLMCQENVKIQAMPVLGNQEFEISIRNGLDGKRLHVMVSSADHVIKIQKLVMEHWGIGIN